MCKVIHVLTGLLLSLAHCDNVLIVESASLVKLLQSMTGNQLVIAVSHDDMQTQLVKLTFGVILV